MEIKPFKGFRFEPKVVGDVKRCIAPPFDVIGPALQQQLYEKSEYNIVRITKGKTNSGDNNNNNQYTRAADYLNRWIKAGVLRQDPEEVIYAYVQDFQLGQQTSERLSFIAVTKLEEFGSPGRARPHEQVFDQPMMDRLNLQRATAAGFGLVSMLYEDKQKIADKIIEKAAREKSLIDFASDQNGRHRLFAITAKEDIDAIVQMMSDKSCIIADGHHRYTSCLRYSKESGNPAAEYQMLSFTNICQQGLKLLATHRLVGDLENFKLEELVAGLKENFEVTELLFDSPGAKTEAKQRMVAQMQTACGADRNALGIYGGNNAFYAAVLKDKRAMASAAPDKSAAWKSLDVAVLHKLVLEKLLGIDEQKIIKDGNVQYVKGTPDAIDDLVRLVDAGQRQVFFFMNPVKMQQLQKVTAAGERMPQKSTYFYPKMYTGLVIQKI
jgi:uncharacterized protein (DUF1015 family)